MTRGLRIPALLFAFLLVGACSDDTEPPADGGPDAADFSTDISPADGQPDTKPDAGPDLPPLPDKGPPTEAGVCDLRVIRINALSAIPSEISSLDDQDGAADGIQLTVLVDPGTVADGTDVELKVTGLSPNPTAKVVSGFATFTNVTVAQTVGDVSIEASAPGCQSTPVTITVIPDPTCNFDSPKEASTLTETDDEVPNNGNKFEKTIALVTQNAVGGVVEAQYVGGANLGSKTVPAGGKVSYPKQLLATTPGAKTDLKLSATVEISLSNGAKIKKTCLSSDLTSTELSFSVDTSVPSCQVSIPNLQQITGGFGLGPAQDADPSTPGFQLEVQVTTDNGKPIIVSLSGSEASDPQNKTIGPPSQTVSNGSATFTVTIDDGEWTVRADCADQATTNTNTTGPSVFILDTVAPQAVGDVMCSVDTAVSNHRKGILTCEWTQATDPGTSASGVEEYDLHCVPNADLVPANFAAAPIKLSDDPKTPTAKQKAEIDKLSIPNAYSCAVVARDKLGNESDVSNVTTQVKLEFQPQELVGAANGSAFGFPVVAGDFNCDGLVDIAVGLNAVNNKKGEVLLYFSGGTGFPATASKRLSGTIANAGFGIGLAALNYDGDIQGCDDLAVYAVGDGGSVYLYLGRPVWQDRTDVEVGKGAEIIYRRPTGTTGELIGLSLAGLDINGDSKADLAMTNIVFGGTSRVFVDFGETVTLMGTGISPIVREMPTAADLTINAGATGASELFGIPLANGGRLNGDNTDELVIGARKTQVAGQTRGAVYVIKGDATATAAIDVTTSSRAIRIDGGSTNAAFGRSVAGVGDLNGDGVREFVVTDNERTVNGRAKAGTAYVFSLLPSTPATAADAKLVIENDRAGAEDDGFGISVASSIRVSADGADLDKDTYADLIIGMAQDGATTGGAAKLFYGKTGALSGIAPQGVNSATATLAPSGATASHSSVTLLVADTNGDTFADFIVTDFQYSSSRGRVIVYD